MYMCVCTCVPLPWQDDICKRVSLPYKLYHSFLSMGNTKGIHPQSLPHVNMEKSMLKRLSVLPSCICMYLSSVYFTCWFKFPSLFWLATHLEIGSYRKESISSCSSHHSVYNQATFKLYNSFVASLNKPILTTEQVYILS